MTMSREYKVGLFIGCTVFIIMTALLYLAFSKGTFERIHTFTLSSRSGEGFMENMPVVFSGFNIGYVHTLELNEEGVVLIYIKIPDRHVKWIRADSSFVLYRPLIGSSRIIVNTENLKSPPLDPQKIPEVVTVNDINDAIAKIEPVLDRVTEIAENIQVLTRNLSDPKGDFHRVLGNAEKITANFASKKSLVEMAVSDKESVEALNESLKKLKDITNNIDRVLVKVDKIADKTDKEIYGENGALPQINIILKDLVSKLKKLDKTVDNINSISTDASQGMKDLHILRSDIDDSVKSIDDVAKKLDAIIGSKKSPEFRVP